MCFTIFLRLVVNRWVFTYEERLHTAQCLSLFTLRAHAQLRRHRYMLEKQRCTNSIRHTFFCNRIVIVNIWNSLPSDTTDFSSFLKFRRSFSNEYLAQHCKLNFI